MPWTSATARITGGLSQYWGRKTRGGSTRVAIIKRGEIGYKEDPRDTQEIHIHHHTPDFQPDLPTALPYQHLPIMKASSAVLAVALAGSAAAHTIFQELYVNGVSAGHTTGIRVPSYDGVYKQYLSKTSPEGQY